MTAARTWLVNRRQTLLTELYELAAVAGATEIGEHARGAGQQADAAAGATSNLGPEAPAGSARRREISGTNAARLLVAAGAVLVVIAATAFTVANWAQVGPLARSAILLVVTAPVLAAPRAILRRGLMATAESVAAIGLALTVGDLYLAGQLIPGRPNVALAAAIGTAALAWLWAAYGRVIRLRVPGYAAVFLAQLPGVFAAVWLTGLLDVHVALGLPVAVALVAAACVDLMFANPAAHVAGALTWGGGLLTACAVQVAGTRAGWAWLAVVFTIAAFAGIVLAPRTPGRWIPAAQVAVVCGALLAVAVAVPAALVLPGGWELAALSGAAVAVSGVAWSLGRRHIDRPDASGVPSGRYVRPPFATHVALVAAGSAAIAACCAVIAAPVALLGLQPRHPVTGFWVAAHRGGPPIALPAWPALPSVVIVLGLTSVGCLLAAFAFDRRSVSLPWAFGTAALAAGALPAAAGLTGGVSLAVLTGSVALLLAGGFRARGSQASAHGWALVLAAAAVAWSATSPAATIAVLTALTILFFPAAALARDWIDAMLSTAGSLAAAAGLAWAVPLALGWPARYAAFAVLAAAVAAVAVATPLRQRHPIQSLVLDVGAAPVVIIAGLMAAHSADTFALVASSAAVVASAAAWLRTGRRRFVALAGAGYSIMAGVVAQGGAIAAALFTPYRSLAHTWRGHAMSYVSAAHRPDLALATGVLAVCLAAAVSAFGAWRGNGRASLDAVAAALPLIAAPVGLSAGIGYGLIVGALLALALALTAWASCARSVAPAGAALVLASFALSWALIAPMPTLIVLGCLTAGYACAAWRARLTGIRVAAACLTVLCGAAFAECAALAAGRPVWQAGLAVVAIAAAAQGVSVLLRHPLVGPAIEIAAWLATAAGVAQCLNRQDPASLALAISGLTCLAVAIRPRRRRALWAGLALCQAAWCFWLAATGVGAPEPYTLPVAAVLLAVGWHIRRRRPAISSWLTFGPGLALVVLPSLVAVWSGPGWQNVGWHDTGWIRAAALCVVAVVVAVVGGRLRLQAPLLFGAVVAVLDAVRELAPAVRDLVGLLPAWVPIAVLGAALLWAGATYEARLRNLVAVRRSLAALR